MRGKAESTSSTVQVGRDHPRVCGEKEAGDILPSDNAGSPPRMRGKECGKVENYVESGITPAYAGKSLHRLAP